MFPLNGMNNNNRSLTWSAYCNFVTKATSTGLNGSLKINYNSSVFILVFTIEKGSTLLIKHSAIG